MNLRAALRTLLTLGKGTMRGLPPLTAERDPIELFGEQFAAAAACGVLLPEAAALATVGADGKPSARMVLLKDFDRKGFVFFTNYESRKARDMQANPQVALVFHWASLQRQVRIEGTAEQISREESEAYFRTRPRGSQVGAWASDQSAILENRQLLESKARDIEQRYADADIPLPPLWGGYRLVPDQIEFWQGRIDRLHDRILFVSTEDGWRASRLYP
jgi:pyridoxamine 5'-phosphate oxidase